MLVVLRVTVLLLCQFFCLSSGSASSGCGASGGSWGAGSSSPRPARRTRRVGLDLAGREAAAADRAGRLAARALAARGLHVFSVGGYYGDVNACVSARGDGAHGPRAPSIRWGGWGGRRRACLGYGRGSGAGARRRGARRGARDADIRLAIGLPEFRDAARGRRIWGQGARPTSGFGTGWCPPVSAVSRALGFAGSLLPLPLLGPTPHQNPHLCGSAPTRPRLPPRRGRHRLRMEEPNQASVGPNSISPTGLPHRFLLQISSYGPT